MNVTGWLIGAGVIAVYLAIVFGYASAENLLTSLRNRGGNCLDGGRCLWSRWDTPGDCLQAGMVEEPRPTEFRPGIVYDVQFINFEFREQFRTCEICGRVESRKF